MLSAPSSAPPVRVSALGPHDRIQALEQLQAAAVYFREAEPTQPSSYLIERAIRWADTPLRISFKS